MEKSIEKILQQAQDDIILGTTMRLEKEMGIPLMQNPHHLN
jgi:hypothetical protein